MIHNLTIGHLDPNAIDERRAIVLKPLDPGIVAKHLSALGRHDNTGWTLDGMTVEEKDGYMICRWLVGPRRNFVAEELALRIQKDTGCLIADREHYRVVEPGQLEGLMGREKAAS
jgi:hypothetical protein